jgi:hypothetical protein
MWDTNRLIRLLFPSILYLTSNISNIHFKIQTYNCSPSSVYFLTATALLNFFRKDIAIRITYNMNSWYQARLESREMSIWLKFGGNANLICIILYGLQDTITNIKGNHPIVCFQKLYKFEYHCYLDVKFACTHTSHN